VVNYLIRRLIQMLLVVIVASMAIYFLLYLSPGGPLSGLGGQSGARQNQVTAQDIERVSQYLGLHRGPVWGYLAWLTGEDWMDAVPQSMWPRSQLSGEPVSLQLLICQQDSSQCGRGVLRGDFGVSWQVARGSPVGDVLASRLRNTLILMVGATLLSLVIAIPIGIYSAVHQYSRLDYIFTTFSFLGTAMPVFWFGLMIIMILGGNQSPLYKLLHLPYMPTGNVTLVRAPLPGSLEALLEISPGTWQDIAVHAILPTLVLSMLYMAGWSRFMRTAMLEVLRQDYVRTPKACANVL
jgi:peptide/nickel transport system permease protein